MGNEINLIQVEQFIKNFKNENLKEVISITTYPNKPVDITSSKFGGTFYLPKNAQIPTNNEGEQLTFLAQITVRNYLKIIFIRKKELFNFGFMEEANN